MGLKNVVKRCVSQGLYRTGLLDLIGWCRRRRVTILSFHCVSGPGRRYFRDAMSVDADHFADLIRLLQWRYRLVSLDEAAREAATGRRRGRPAVAITFDDGYRNVFDFAFPVLRAAGAPATVFLPTDFIGTSRLLWWDEVWHLAGHDGEADPAAVNAEIDRLSGLSERERDEALARMRARAGDVPPPERLMMSWDEVREMAAAGIDFGAHTVSHCFLDALPPDRLREELERSREIIREQVGRTPTGFAYPDGRFNDAVREATRAAGFAHAVTTVNTANRPPCDPFALARYDGSMPFTGGGREVSFPILWSELLGVWDLLFLRRWRTPLRFLPERTAV